MIFRSSLVFLCSFIQIIFNFILLEFLGDIDHPWVTSQRDGPSSKFVMSDGHWLSSTEAKVTVLSENIF